MRRKDRTLRATGLSAIVALAVCACFPPVPLIHPDAGDTGADSSGADAGGDADADADSDADTDADSGADSDTDTDLGTESETDSAFAPLPNGSFCTQGTQCDSGWCDVANGLCCDRDIDGTAACCTASQLSQCGGFGCDISGPFFCFETCRSYPKEGDPRCADGFYCQDNGCWPKKDRGTRCGLPKNCLSNYCDHNVCCDSGTCCTVVEQIQCEPYVCDGALSQCRVACSGNDDSACAPGYHCVDGECQPDQ